MLLLPSEWSLKTGAQCILAYVDSPPMQMSQPQTLRGCWTKVHPICSHSNLFIDGVNATIRVAISVLSDLDPRSRPVFLVSAVTGWQVLIVPLTHLLSLSVCLSVCLSLRVRMSMSRLSIKSCVARLTAMTRVVIGDGSDEVTASSRGRRLWWRQTGRCASLLLLLSSPAATRRRLCVATHAATFTSLPPTARCWSDFIPAKAEIVFLPAQASTEQCRSLPSVAMNKCCRYKCKLYWETQAVPAMQMNTRNASTRLNLHHLQCTEFAIQKPTTRTA